MIDVGLVIVIRIAKGFGKIRRSRVCLLAEMQVSPLWQGEKRVLSFHLCWLREYKLVEDQMDPRRVVA